MITTPTDVDNLTVITLVVKRQTHDNGMTLEQYADAVIAGTHPILNHFDFVDQFSATDQDLTSVINWATNNSLKIIESDSAKSIVVVQASIQQINSLFNIACQTVTTDTRTYQTYTGTITIPSDILNVVERVIGLDESVEIKNHIKPLPELTSNQVAQPVTPPQVRTAYRAPPGDGTGITIGILELDGGWTQSDINLTFNRIGLRPPAPVNVGLYGGSNNGSSDAETMMDIYCASGCANKSTIVTYFSTNTTAGFYNGILGVALDSVNNPSVLSISWGYSSDISDSDPSYGLGGALQACITKGILVFFASGDDGGNGWTPCYPGTSNYAISCGGTSLYLNPDYSISSQSTWSGSGGGVSAYQSLPSWQSQQKLYYTTITANGAVGNPTILPSRGAPDISAPADPYTGYQFYTQGALQTNGGTSAAAPFLAGLFAIIIQNLGSRINFNTLMTLLYAPTSNNAFYDIVTGQNNQDWHQLGIPYVNGYKATIGWDAATGLGSPYGYIVLSLLQGQAPIPPAPPPVYLDKFLWPRPKISWPGYSTHG